MIRIEKDLLVVGAGLAGMCAAISAARHGLQVALINDRPVLGGNASTEIGVGISGSCNGGYNASVYSKEGGLIEEIRQRLLYAFTHRGFDRVGATDAVFFEMIHEEPNIQLFLNTTAREVCVESGRIQSVTAYNSKSETEFLFVCPQYADCSGDGIVAFRAGSSFAMGSESQAQYGEKWGKPEATSNTMGHSVYWEIEDTGKPVKFVAPSFAYDITQMETFDELANPVKFRELGVSGHLWTLEYGGQVNTIQDFEEISWMLKRLAYGIWDYVKNSGKFPKAETYIMKRLQVIPGTRESRRFFGDHVLTENDIEQKVDFPDAVAVGGWPMDVHDPEGFFGKLPASNFIPVTGLYRIPFRCLYAKDLDNLMLAGRNISASHIALGSTRVMATCACLGQAVGTAAVLCLRHGKDPRAVCRDHMPELLDLLAADDQTIPGRSALPRENLNGAFSISSTGCASFENPRKDFYMACDHNYVLALTLDSERIDSVQLDLRNDTPEPQTVTVEAFTGVHPETFLPTTLLVRQTITLPANHAGFITVPIGREIGPDRKVYLVLPKNPAISLGCANTAVPGAVTWRYYDPSHTLGDYRDPNRIGYTHDSIPLSGTLGYTGCDRLPSKNICFQNVQPAQKVYSAENLLNSQSRPHGIMNMWISPSADATLTLTAHRPTDVRQLHLVFDTDLERDNHRSMQPVLVKDYDLEIDAGGITYTHCIRDNCLRLNRHRIDREDVTAIRLHILAMHGDGTQAHMYGIKLL